MIQRLQGPCKVPSAPVVSVLVLFMVQELYSCVWLGFFTRLLGPLFASVTLNTLVPPTLTKDEAAAPGGSEALTPSWTWGSQTNWAQKKIPETGEADQTLPLSGTHLHSLLSPSKVN